MEWVKLGEQTILEGWRTIVARRYRTPDGAEREFEIKVEPDTAVILAIAGDEVVLVREYRPGPEETLLELPGGAIDDGEDPLDAARRELLEETGYAGADLREVGSTLDCAYSTRTRHVFVTTNCAQVQSPAPHDGEFPEVVLVPLAAFRRHLQGGRLTDVGPGYLALDALNLL